MNATTMNLTCQWALDQDSLLTGSRITLKGFRSRRDCDVRLEAIADCIPPAGQNSCTFPRQSLHLYQNMIFQVTVENALGAVESEPLCTDPMDVVKLDPPALWEVQSVPEETDCVSVEWEAATGSVHMELACELRYRPEGEQGWQLVHNITSSSPKAPHCGLFFGTRYQLQMRCQRLPASYWSEWSPTKHFTTHEKAPSGELDAWWRRKPPAGPASRAQEVQLLWKPMKPNEANGKILGYWATLSTRTPGQKRPATLCNTTETHCTFSLTPGALMRIHLVAYNSRGPSQPTLVSLFEKQGPPVPKIRVSPHDRSSFWVSWDPPGAPATGYVIEWHRVTSGDPLGDRDLGWTKLPGGDLTQALIQAENIWPYQPYNISLYPLYKDGVGMPQHVAAYTLQKAPSETPKLQAWSITKTTAELHWEPILVERQNGFITNYTIFWIGTDEDMNSAVVNASEDTFTITGLWPARRYEVHMMASTAGGQTNGTTLMLYTKAMDGTDIPFVYGLTGLLLLMIIVLVICFQKSKRMKTQFWPSVPDPANSSLGRWAPAVLHQENLPPPKACELSPVVVSALLVAEADGKTRLCWGQGEPAQEGCPGSPERDAHDAEAPRPSRGPPAAARRASYMNSAEALQYGLLLGGGGGGGSYCSQRDASPCLVSVRPGSTRPLLGSSLAALSPVLLPPYENLLWPLPPSPQPEGGPARRRRHVQEEEGAAAAALTDFPLLRGVMLDGDEDLSHLRGL
ncbi:granulocyte colony-stimulating factor receptor isoform X2 [Hemicordylus capensis]|nr:granulocyte colony-stimulating factor receptor isoform X2 [Hemicordylus capensis]